MTRILLEGKYLFDFVDLESDLSKYKLLILPDEEILSGALLDKVTAFVKGGGRLLATGKSALTPDMKFAFDLGCEYISEGEYKPTYVRPVSNISGMGDTAYVVYERAENVKATGKEHAFIERPYFNRTREHFCSHRHAPASGEYYGAGITEGKDGIYISFAVFNDYAIMGSLSSKQLVTFAIDRLLGDSRTVRINLPAQGIVTLQRQGERLINHLLYASPVRRGKSIEVIEDIIPVHNVEVELLLDKAPSRVYLAPECVDIPFSFENGRLSYTVPKVDCHAMVVIEP